MASAPTSLRATVVASLPMYDWPEISPIVDRLWEGVASRLRDAKIAAPTRLDRRQAYEDVWVEPGLVLSQTCGYPYAMALRSRAALVGAPVYDAPGCIGATYRSFLVVRRDDCANSIAGLRGRRAAINSRHSQSGYSALRAAIAPFAGGRSFFGSVTVSGGHRASLQAVADGAADVAAVDAVCWALADRHEPAACARLRVLAESPEAPSLPFITSAAMDPIARGVLLEVLRQAIAAQASLFRKELLLVDVEGVTDAAYDRIHEIERCAVHMGYPEVA